MSDLIQWEQAMSDFQHNNERDIVEAKRLIDEIETSNFSVLDARDIHYYAGRLNELTNRKEPYTANEIRRMNMDSNDDVDQYDMIASFYEDETDDIIDFF